MKINKKRPRLAQLSKTLILKMGPMGGGCGGTSQVCTYNLVALGSNPKHSNYLVCSFEILKLKLYLLFECQTNENEAKISENKLSQKSFLIFELIFEWKNRYFKQFVKDSIYIKILQWRNPGNVKSLEKEKPKF